MALAIGAHIPSLDSLFHPEVSARSFSVLQTRQNSTSGRNNSTASNNENTVNLFIDGYSEDFEYGASIINVCAGTTTMALQCLSPATVRVPLLATSITCGTNAEKITATVAPNYYAVSSSTILGGTTALVAETCELGGTTAATCTATISGNVGGKSASTTATTTMTGAGYYRYDVAITAGAEKTVNPPAQCTSASNSGAGASNPSAGTSNTSVGATFGTKTMAIWGFFGFATFATMIAL